MRFLLRCPGALVGVNPNPSVVPPALAWVRARQAHKEASTSASEHYPTVLSQTLSPTPIRSGPSNFPAHCQRTSSSLLIAVFCCRCRRRRRRRILSSSRILSFINCSSHTCRSHSGLQRVRLQQLPPADVQRPPLLPHACLRQQPSSSSFFSFSHICVHHGRREARW